MKLHTMLALGFSLALTATACGNDECEDATEKLEECGVNLPVGSCDTETDECEAKCINSHSCDEINAGLSGTPNAYTACDDACN